MVEQLGLPVVEIRPCDQLQRIVHAKVVLRALLDLVRLADDLVRVDTQLRVARPRAVAHVRINLVPVPSIVPRVERLGMAGLTQSSMTVSTACPDEIVGLQWMEVQDLKPEGVWGKRRVKSVPRLSSVGGIVVCFALGDEIGSVVAVFVVVERNKLLVREQLRPSVTLVGGLPDGVVRQSNQDSLSPSISRDTCMTRQNHLPLSY